MKLNADQTSAVQATGHTLVVACPGSGKTRILVERAARILEHHPDSRIILVTFTRQAAAELRARLREKLSNLDHLRISTFHSLALEQLLAARWSRICGPSEQRALLRVAASSYLDDEEFQSFCAAADAYTSGHKSSLDTPEYQRAYDDYLDLMAKHSAVDIGQSIQIATDQMMAGTIKPLHCHYLLVDEVQDIDPTQLKWVMAHADAGAELTAVGDDDQSIYAWRFSLGYRGMQSLRQSTGASVIRLSINYRSRTEILGLSSKLIGHNRQRLNKALYSARGPGGRIHLHVACWTDHDEARTLASQLVQDAPPTAVIARTNRKLDLVARVLSDYDIPFTRVGRKSFWELDEPALMLRLLRGRGYIDPMTQTALQARMTGNAHDNSPLALADALKATHQSGQASKSINAVAAWLSSNLSGFSASRAEAARELIESARSALLSLPGTLAQRLLYLSRPPTASEERVVLVTMHGAKGREWPNVWLFGCQDGTIPSSRSDDLEEERRLMYVAMTRAEDDLHISFAWNQLIIKGDTTHLRRLTPSRFLSTDLSLPIPKREDIERSVA